MHDARWKHPYTLLFTAIAVTCLSFTAGFVACLHAKSSSSPAVRAAQLDPPGDASTAARGEIVARLRAFQQGYEKRDVAELDDFIAQNFSADGDLVLLGTEAEASEWIRGVPAAKRFIENDWRSWGDFRFDADRAIIGATNDTAWVASLGTVDFNHHPRPVRFTAVLSRDQNRWVFRQIQFDWDDRDPRPSDLLHPSTYFHIARNLAH